MAKAPSTSRTSSNGISNSAETKNGEGAIDLFRFVAVRATRPRLGTIAEIPLGLDEIDMRSGNSAGATGSPRVGSPDVEDASKNEGEERTDILTAIDESGDFATLPVPDPSSGTRSRSVQSRNSNGVRQLPLAELDKGLALKNDRVAPEDIEQQIKQATGYTLEDLIKLKVWEQLRVTVHSMIVEMFAEEGDLSTQQVSQLTSLLRMCRLLGLIESIGTESLEPSSADGVHLFMQYSMVTLPPSKIKGPLNALSRPPLIADLKVVRLGPARYEPGQIAHIENILKSELRERAHRILDQNESITTIVRETTRENIRDLTTTSNFNLQVTAKDVTAEITDFEAGVKVSADYGPSLHIDADGNASSHNSREHANESVTAFANSVVQRCVDRTIERVMETRTVRHLIETEEKNLHSFDNRAKNADHIRGIYRYVDLVRDAWMENYGKRTMLEFMVPEPAAIFQWANKMEEEKDDDPEPKKPTHPDNPKLLLTPSDITRDNYRKLVGIGIKEPPPAGEIHKAKTFSSNTNQDPFMFQDKIVVPDGYEATTWTAVAELWGKSGNAGREHSWMVNVGSGDTAAEDNTTNLRKKLNGPIIAPANSEIGIAVLARGYIAINTIVTVYCKPTTVYTEWQQSVFDSVMDYWEREHQDWVERKLKSDLEARANASASLLLGSTNPEENRVTERRELRRCVIEMLLGNPAYAGAFKERAVTRPDNADEKVASADPKLRPLLMRPRLDLGVVATERSKIQFLEQAFEWTNMTWLHYPYYWADGGLWQEFLRKTSNDALWTSFLTAGYSRVSVPVRRGFETAVSLYLATGKVFTGSGGPTVGKAAYLGIAEEIAESIGATVTNPDKTPLTPVRLPTQLVWLQQSGELNEVKQL